MRSKEKVDPNHHLCAFFFTLHLTPFFKWKSEKSHKEKKHYTINLEKDIKLKK